jgi:hypothetical protein
MGTRPILFSGLLTGWTWTFILMTAGIAAVMAATRSLVSVAPIFSHHAESGSYVPGTLSVGTGLLYFGPILLLSPMFDRYLLPFFLSAALAYALNAHQFSTKSSVSPLACAVVLAALSWTITRDFLVSSEARWRAADWALATGQPASAIDGGYEWLGWNPFLLRSLNIPRPFKLIVATSPLAGYTEIHREPYYSVWPPHERAMYVLEKDSNSRPDTSGAARQ